MLNSVELFKRALGYLKMIYWADLSVEVGAIIASYHCVTKGGLCSKEYMGQLKYSSYLENK